MISAYDMCTPSDSSGELRQHEGLPEALLRFNPVPKEVSHG